jgi:hypothetical protein
LPKGENPLDVDAGQLLTKAIDDPLLSIKGEGVQKGTGFGFIKWDGLFINVNKKYA